MDVISESTEFIILAKLLFTGAKQSPSNIYNKSAPEKQILDFCGPHPPMRRLEIVHISSISLIVRLPRRNGDEIQ